MNAETPALLRPAFTPGHLFTPAEQYHAIEAMSASGAKRMLQSPAHYRLFRTEPKEPTAAMQFGTAVHCGVLEPDAWALRVCCAPDVDKRTRDGKAAWTDFTETLEGRIPLSATDYERAQRCIDAVRAHPAAARLLAGAAVEGSLFWRDAKYDVPCKARYDARNLGGLIDLKTCQDASPEGFGRQSANLLYHVQAAHYVSGAEHALDESPQFFAFICVESELPYAVACYSVPGAAIMAGAYRMNEALARYRDALAVGAWPGYPDTIETLQLPKYALRFD